MYRHGYTLNSQFDNKCISTCACTCTCSLMHIHVCYNTAGIGSGGPTQTGVSVPDCRGIVKTLVCGMKTITWGAGSCKLPGSTVDYCKITNFVI